LRHKADFDYLPYFLIGPTLPKREIGVDISYEYSTLGCIKKIWEVDPLECPKCGREMSIISYIIEASAIRQIPHGTHP
jgi:hypothetical protein